MAAETAPADNVRSIGAKLAGQAPTPEDPKLRVGPQLGKSGLKAWAGFVQEEFLHELRGPMGIRMYEEMRSNEPNIAGLLAAIEMVILSVEWRAVPASQEANDLAAASFLEQAIENLESPWEDFLSDICTMFAFGWALFEEVYKYEDGKIFWKKFAFRSQDSLFRWKFSEDSRKLEAMVQMPPPDYTPIEIPIEKCVLFRTRAEKENPEGRSMLRPAYKPYFYKRVIEEIEAMGAERDLIGIPVMSAPFGASEAEIALAKQIVESIKNDDQAGIVLTAIGPEPQDKFEFKLVTGQGSSGRVSFTDRLIARYSNEMMMAALSQFLRLGQGGAGGSYALSSDQRDIFQIAIRGWMAKIRNTLNRGPVKKLLLLNGMRGKATLEHGQVGATSLQTLANFLNGGIQNGYLTPNRELEQFLRKQAELPPLPDGEKTAGEKAEQEKQDAAKAAAEQAAMAPPPGEGLPPEAGGPPPPEGGPPPGENPPGEKGKTTGINSSPGANQQAGLPPGVELKEPVPFRQSKAMAEVLDDAFEGAAFNFIESWEDEADGDVHPFEFANPYGRQKGGKFGYRPGGIGPGGKTFDTAVWKERATNDLGGTRAEWGAMSQAHRDMLADPVNSIPATMAAHLEGVGEASHVGTLPQVISNRVNQYHDRLTPEAEQKVMELALDLGMNLDMAGVSAKLSKKLSTDAIDAIVAQEVEAAGRSLGDHGVHHIKGDADVANTIMDAVPGADPARQKAILQLTAAYHDIGYLTPPAHAFLDEGHHRWSGEYFDKHVAPAVSEAFGSATARKMSTIIRTHDSTEMDWKQGTMGSAFRLADNLALFHKEKLPPVARYVKGNIDVLSRLGGGQIDLQMARGLMHDNIRKADVAPRLKEQMHHAVDEVNPLTPKFMLGVVGTSMKDVTWRKDHPVVSLRKTKANENLAKVLDVGQRQFSKLAETYGVDPQGFAKTGHMEFTKDGNVLLEANVSTTKFAEMLLEFANDRHDARGRFAPKGTGSARLGPKGIANTTKREGGITYSTRAGVKITTGVSVSPYPERSEGLSLERFNSDARYRAKATASFLRKNADLLKKPNHVFGSWEDSESGKVFHDVSVVVKTRRAAINLAKKHDQIAVYDLSTGETITVDRNAKSGGVA
jgi:hypothetical protein